MKKLGVPTELGQLKRDNLNYWIIQFPKRCVLSEYEMVDKGQKVGGPEYPEFNIIYGQGGS